MEKLVGMARFEPAASRFRTEYSDQAELHPELENLVCAAGLEPTASCSRSRRSTRLSYAQRENLKGGRDGRTRTDDIVLPKHALYQAELHPENLGHEARRCQAIYLVFFEFGVPDRI